MAVNPVTDGAGSGFRKGGGTHASPVCHRGRLAFSRESPVEHQTSCGRPDRPFGPRTARPGPGSPPTDRVLPCCAARRCARVAVSTASAIPSGLGVGGGEAIENGSVLVGGEARGALGQRHRFGSVAQRCVATRSPAATPLAAAWARGSGSTASPLRHAASAGATFPRASSALPRLNYAGAKARFTVGCTLPCRDRLALPSLARQLGSEVVVGLRVVGVQLESPCATPRWPRPTCPSAPARAPGCRAPRRSSGWRPAPA